VQTKASFRTREFSQKKYDFFKKTHKLPPQENLKLWKFCHES